MFAWGVDGFNLTTGGEARYAQGLWVSGDFFNTLGVTPLLGRALTPADDRRGCAAPPAVISYGFWQREFGGSPSAIGRSLHAGWSRLRHRRRHAAEFFRCRSGPRVRRRRAAVRRAAQPRRRVRRSTAPDVWFLSVFGRLKADWSAEKASAQLASISRADVPNTLPTRYGADDAKSYLNFKLGAFAAGNWRVVAPSQLRVAAVAAARDHRPRAVHRLRQSREPDARAGHRRASARSPSGWRSARRADASSGRCWPRACCLRPSAPRAAPPSRMWLSQFLVGFLTTDIESHFRCALALDWRIFAFTAALALATCLLFGLLPAIRATRTRAGRRDESGQPRLHRHARAFRPAPGARGRAGRAVAGARGRRAVVRAQPPQPDDARRRASAQDGVVIANLDLRRTGIVAERAAGARSSRSPRAWRALPGVQAAAQAFIVPVSGSGLEQQHPRRRQDSSKSIVNFNAVSADYFKTMGTPMLAGPRLRRSHRHARREEGGDRQRIVREEVLRGSAIRSARCFQIEEAPGAPRPLYRDRRRRQGHRSTRTCASRSTPIGYFPPAQGDPKDLSPFMQVVLRSNAPLTTVTSEVSAAVAQINPSIVLQFADDAESQVRDSLLRERLMATLSGFFGGLAALIATIGLYGVMSYMVARRRNEIGIRMALGADRARRRAHGDARGGPCCWPPASWWVSWRPWRPRGPPRTLLFGLSPEIRRRLLMAAAGLGVVAMLASYLPALRASRLEPTEALREE